MRKSEQLKQQEYREIRELIDKVRLSETTVAINYGNPVSLALWGIPLTEGLIMTYPFEKVINIINSTFKGKDVKAEKVIGNEKEEMIVVSFPYSEENLVTMNKVMDYCGYFLSFQKLINGGMKIATQYEPKFQNNIRQELNGDDRFICHVSSSTHKKKILKDGLTPRTKNNIFNYPDRIYFFKLTYVTKQTQNFISLVDVITLKDRDQEWNRENKYTIFYISVNKLPDNIEFFNDPNTEYAVYTKQNIPPDAIIKTSEITLPSLKK